jgi:hypothetical protein
VNKPERGNVPSHLQNNLMVMKKRDKLGRFTKTHGEAHSRTNRIWAGMKQRCDNSNSHIYKYYGDKGITYEKKWAEYEGFLEDMGQAPIGKSLDRIDNNKGYCKENCRWASNEEQANNRNNVVLYKYNGKFYSVTQLAKISTIPADTIKARIVRLKWSVERAILSPIDERMSFPKYSEHGTITRYKKGCRCKDCKRENAKKSRIFRQRSNVNEKIVL